MRLTTLLDTIPQGGSGAWTTAPLAAPPSTDPQAGISAGTAVAPTAFPARTDGGDAREFDRIVSGLIPCRVHDAELWFAERQVDVELAKSLCADCPLVSGCLAGAIERREPWGVWGGQVFVDGVVVATKRGRGRPRKVA
ncbi:WhiB family transcriptional regulator [Luteimicrobium subarcticum]|uniref:Transcriptional regulator WhiB n=1 Tax=Luteimicrobium subarcticum TaxID=620910 RepID=A0A2M8WV00_9MICO|nr:WhiB family transcriptional regulator [Luteimicrobium subarcticum]PJI94744.1 WhiB family redox-sensing transcriptional regulator [Luteimicrobium subarcticum]